MNCATCKGFGYLLTAASACTAGGNRVTCPVCTPSQRLDAATVERCAEHLDERAANRKAAEERARADGDIEDAVTHARIGNSLRSAATAVRALATEPHQHGGKGA